MALAQVSLLRIHWTDAGNHYITPREYLTAHRVNDSALVRGVNRGESPYWDVVVFDKQGGRYDSATACIAGKSKRGTDIVISADDLCYTEYRERNSLKLKLSALASGPPLWLSSPWA